MKLLRLFKASLESRKLRGEHVELPTTSNDILSSPPTPSVLSDQDSDTISFINSEDPSDSVNLEHSYLVKNTGIQLTSTNSRNRSDDLKNQFNLNNKNKEYLELLEKIKHHKTVNDGINVCINEFSNATKSMNCDGFSEFKIFLNNSNSIMGESFIITKEYKKETTTRLQKQFTASPKAKLFRNVLSKLLKQKRRLMLNEKRIADWSCEKNKFVKFPLSQKTYALMYNENSQKVYGTLANGTGRFSLTDFHSSFESLPQMFDHFRHIKNIVKRVSPFYPLKDRITKCKFRDMLLKFSPTSKISRLTIEHLVFSKLKLPVTPKIPPLRKIIINDILPCSEHSNDVIQKQLNTEEISDFGSNESNSLPQTLHKYIGNNPAISPILSFIHDPVSHEDSLYEHDEYTRKNQKQCWDELNKFAFPDNQASNILPPVSENEMKKFVKTFFKKNQELPKNAIPILKQLILQRNSLISRSLPRPTILPLKVLWILRNIGIVKHVVLPSKHSPMSRIRNAIFPSQTLGHTCSDESITSTHSSDKSTDPFESYKRSSHSSEVFIKASDTDIWRSYFSGHERKIRRPLSFFKSPSNVGKPLVKKKLSSNRLKTVNAEHILTSETQDEDLEETTSVLVEEKPKKKLPETRQWLFEESLSMDKSKEEWKNNYITFLKTFLSYYNDEKLFPISNNLCILEQETSTKYNRASLEFSPQGLSQETPMNGEKIERTEKDGGRRCLIPRKTSQLSKVSVKLLKYAEREKCSKKFYKTHSSNKITKCFLDSNVPKRSSPMTCQTLREVVKDGPRSKVKQFQSASLSGLWQQLYENLLLHFKDECKISKPYLKSQHYLHQWRQIFGFRHPMTVESFVKYKTSLKFKSKRKNQVDESCGLNLSSGSSETKDYGSSEPGRLSTNEKTASTGSEESDHFKCLSEIYFPRILRDSMPKGKDPDAPSDEIESLSSLEFIVDAETQGEENKKYSLYSRQKVKLKTTLKSKVWFIPRKNDDSGTSRGIFYYPGDPDWHKGVFSPFLKVPPKDEQKYTKKIAKCKHVRTKRNAQEKCKAQAENNNTKIVKPYRSVPNNENYRITRFLKTKMPFGSYYLLPIRHKRIWKLLAKHIHRHIIISLYSAARDNKSNTSFAPSSLSLKTKPLVVIYKCILASDTAQVKPMVIKSNTNKCDNKYSYAETNKLRSLQKDGAGKNKKELEVEKISNVYAPQEKGNVSNKKRSSYQNQISNFAGIKYCLENTIRESKESSAGLPSSNYLQGLEWGLCKYFYDKKTKPHINNVVEKFQTALFQWINLSIKLEKYYSHLKSQKPGIAPEICKNVAVKRGNEAIKPIYSGWPDSMLKV